MRRVLLCLAACAVVAAAPSLANTGVAFVHGTSDQNDAANDYWTQSFIDSVRQGLPNPSNYVVVNCNFEAYMWTSPAAGWTRPWRYCSQTIHAPA